MWCWRLIRYLQECLIIRCLGLMPYIPLGPDNFQSICYPVQNHVWFVVEWNLCNGVRSIPFLIFHIIIYALNRTEAKFLQELSGSSCCIELIKPFPQKSYTLASFLMNTFKYRYFLNWKETLEICSCDIIRSYKITLEGTLRSHWVHLFSLRQNELYLKNCQE